MIFLVDRGNPGRQTLNEFQRGGAVGVVPRGPGVGVGGGDAAELADITPF